MSNETIQQLASKLKDLYKRTHLLDQVQRRIEKPGEIQSTVPEPLSMQSEEFQYFSMTQHILQKALADISRLQMQKKEILELMPFLELLQKSQVWQHWQSKLVRLPSFYMDCHELTNQQYRVFCDATDRSYPSTPYWNEDYFFQDEYPVIGVSWEDAMAYSIWCKKQLPSIQQWEKAARGTTGSLYPWGNMDPDQTFVNANVPPAIEALESKDIVPVEQEYQWLTYHPMPVHSLAKGRSQTGCYHLAGNVHEWCRDISPFTYSEKMQFSGQEYRITKGGSFNSTGILLSNWFAQPFVSSSRRHDLGFRCVVGKD